jgi:hypothetical protein
MVRKILAADVVGYSRLTEHDDPHKPTSARAKGGN